MNYSKRPKKSAQQDWHRAHILAELKIAGWSLSRLCRHHGYASRATLTNALTRPWPKGQRIIAAAIGVPPQAIWPSRYNPDGSCKGNGEMHAETLDCNAGKTPAPRRKNREMQAAS